MFSRLLTTEGRVNYPGARAQGHVAGVIHTEVLSSLPVGKILNMTPLLRQGTGAGKTPVRKQERPLS